MRVKPRVGIYSFCYDGVLEIVEHHHDKFDVQVWQVIDRRDLDTYAIAPLWIAEAPADQGVMCPKNWELA